jgi:hypothetical protein
VLLRENMLITTVQEEEFDPDYSDIQSSIDKVTVGVSPTGEAEEVFLLEFHVDLDILGHEDKGRKRRTNRN